LCENLQIFVTMATGVGLTQSSTLSKLKGLTHKTPIGTRVLVISHTQAEL